MNSTVNDIADDVERHGERAARGASSEMRNLISDVEELIKRVTNVSDDDVARMRAKVERTLADAKSSINQGGERMRVQADQAMTMTDEYVHERPWAAIGLAAVLGVAIGMLASRRW